MSAVESHASVFRRAARRVALVGALAVGVGLLAGAVAGGTALAGALWGAGAGALMSAMTVGALAFPWHRYPLFSSSGIVLSYVGKIVVMVAVVLLVGPRKETLNPPWFLATLALVLVLVTVTEIAVLARGRALVVEPVSGGGPKH